MGTLTVRSVAYGADGSIEASTEVECESREAPLRWQEQGLSFTASGYGHRIPTSKQVQFNGRWRRVYCRVYSNAGTCYIGYLTKTSAQFVS